MTTFKTAESPFKSDNTASNKCGFTLMNNQVGEVVAQVAKVIKVCMTSIRQASNRMTARPPGF